MDIFNYIKNITDTYGDPRVAKWLNMSSPIPTLTISLTYYIFCVSIGPAFMKNRKPFNLNVILLFYNVIQTVANVWMFLKFLSNGWMGDLSFGCQPVDYSNNPKAVQLAVATWMYHMAKFTELLDTIFFILRKKDNQVTRLHVIHHAVMPISTWFVTRLTPGGQCTFFILLNTAVHIVMYFYYFVAGLGPQYQKYLWWKKYLTTIQMIQFTTILIHEVPQLFVECDFPKPSILLILSHSVLFLVMFYDFYIKEYTLKRSKSS